MGIGSRSMSRPRRLCPAAMQVTTSWCRRSPSMADRVAAVREMRRVACPGGTIAGYVWDFAGEHTPHAPLVRALRRLDLDVPAPPGRDDCTRAALRSLFARAELAAIETTALDIEVH